MFGFIIFVLVLSFVARLFTRPFIGYHPRGFGGWGWGMGRHCHHHHHRPMGFDPMGFGPAGIDPMRRYRRW